MPGDVLFSGDGTRLVGTEIGASAIDSFTVGNDGLLTKASGSPYSAQTGFSTPQGFGQLGSEFSPTDPDQLYVSDAHTAAGTGATPGLVSSFSDAADGSLSLIGPSPASDPGATASCWVEISHDGALSVRRQHGLGDDHDLLDRGRRGAELPDEHDRRSDRRRRRGRPALARRLDALGGRVGN